MSDVKETLRSSPSKAERRVDPVNTASSRSRLVSGDFASPSSSLPSPSRTSHIPPRRTSGSIPGTTENASPVGFHVSGAPAHLGLAHKDSFGQYEAKSSFSTATPPITQSGESTRDTFQGEVSIDSIEADQDLHPGGDSSALDDASPLHRSADYRTASPKIAPRNVSMPKASSPGMRPDRSTSLVHSSTPNRGLLNARTASLSGNTSVTSSLEGATGSQQPTTSRLIRSPLTQGQKLPGSFIEDSATSSSRLEKSSDRSTSTAKAIPQSKEAAKDTPPRRNAVRQQVPTSQTTATNGQANASTLAPATGNGTVRATRLPGARVIPQLPSASNVKPAPPPAMYWSRAPVHGSVPRRSFRAHSACLADEVLWLFGGCDSKGCFHDLYCFDTETMCWSKPKVTGDVPPARRAHSATMVDKRLYVFAGGDGPYYFNDLYIFDTIALRWTKPDIFGHPPSPRRAHTSSYYDGQLIIFGGGNGVGALNDVYSLDITDLNRLEWRKIECGGVIPIGRGYHTSNLVDGKLIVIGGSDGHMSFDDIHILKLDSRTWYRIKTDEMHNRLGHTATQVGSYLFIVGGHDSHSYTPDILTLNLVNLQWEPRTVCGKKPPGRGYHQAWLRDGRLFVHGGFDGKEIYDDLYYIDLSACAYLPQITSFSVELEDD